VLTSADRDIRVKIMSQEQISTIQFREENYPKVIQIANELAELEDRKPHDSIRLLIEEEGRKKIDRLKTNQEHQ